MSLPLLVGEAPSKTGDRYWRFPLSGRPAQVLCALARIPPFEDASYYGRWTWALYDRFECVNLFDRYAEATPWSSTRARARAAELDIQGRVVVCLGRDVQNAVTEALGLERRPFYEWHLGVCVIPHPSGLNRLLNDPGQRRRCGDALRAAMALATSARSATLLTDAASGNLDS